MGSHIFSIISTMADNISQHSTRAKSRSKRLRAHVDYQGMSVSYGRVKLSVPNGFKEMLENVTREILREQPRNIPAFLQVYFQQLNINQVNGVPLTSLVTERIVEVNKTAEAETQDEILPKSESIEVQTEAEEQPAEEEQAPQEENQSQEENQPQEEEDQSEENQPQEENQTEEDEQSIRPETEGQEVNSEPSDRAENSASNRSLANSTTESTKLGQPSQCRLEDSKSESNVCDARELKSSPCASKTKSLENIPSNENQARTISTELILKVSAEELATETEQNAMSMEQKDAENDLNCQEIDCAEEIVDADEPVENEADKWDGSAYVPVEEQTTATPNNSAFEPADDIEPSFEQQQTEEHNETIAQVCSATEANQEAENNEEEGQAKEEEQPAEESQKEDAE